MRLKGFRRTGTLILISRVMGFIRDVLAARLLGASAPYDALLFAVTLPNLARRLFGEGALTNALLPVYGRLKKKKQKELLGGVTRLLLLLMVPFVIAATAVFLLIPERWGSLAALAMPYAILVCFAALFGGVLTVYGRFFPLGFIGVAFNFAWLMGLCFVWMGGGVWSVAALLPVGGLLALLVTLVSLRRLNAAPSFSSSSPHLREVFKGIFPPLVAGFIMVLSTLCDRAIAYGLAPEGGVSVLFLGERLFQLPLALIGVAGGTALFAGLSGGGSGGKESVLCVAVREVVPLSFAAAGGLFLVAPVAVSLLFGGGRFDVASVARTSGVVRLFSLALPAYCAVHLLMRTHYASRRGRVVVIAAAGGFSLNLLTSLLLVVRWGELGVVAGTVLAAWLNGVLLFMRLPYRERREFLYGIGKGWRGFVGASLSVVMAGLCLRPNVTGLVSAVGAGVVCYFGVVGLPTHKERTKSPQSSSQLTHKK